MYGVVAGLKGDGEASGRILQLRGGVRGVMENASGKA